MRSPACILFVATNLQHHVGDFFSDDDVDVNIDGRIYRRLDPEYFAWLRHKVLVAEKAHSLGQISVRSFQAVAARFNQLQQWALEAFGEAALAQAIERLDPKTYIAPGSCRTVDKPAEIAKVPKDGRERAPVSSHRCTQTSPDRSDGQVHPLPKFVQVHSPSRSPRMVSNPSAPSSELSFDHPVTPTAIEKVDRIREKAISLGWTEAELYQTRGRYAFPCGDDYGLVCFISEDQHIGQACKAAIEIHCSGGSVQRFYGRKRP